MRLSYLLILAVTLTYCAPPQPASSTAIIEPAWEAVSRVTDASLRGIHCVNDTVAWASGSGGTVLKCTDGSSWQAVAVSNAETLDFRDIHGFSNLHAVAMSAGNGLHIYQTLDGGIQWTSCYSSNDTNLFYDGFDFDANGFGVIYGDPQNGRISLMTSTDFGASWEEVEASKRPILLPNEAGFAASGTGLVIGSSSIIIATGGGAKSRIISFDRTFDKSSLSDTPLRSGPGMGIFSLCMVDESNGIVVGGSYIDSTNADSNCAITQDGGRTWTLIEQGPRGYRSCVATDPQGQLILAVGRTGSEFSRDQGRSWKPLDSDGYFACSLSETSGWAVGRNGKMARLTMRSGDKVTER